MATLFNELLHRPLVNLLTILYENVTFHDLGLAIIILTVIIRVILFPLFHKTAHHQRMTQKIQPHIKKAQETHKDNKEEQTKAIMQIYKEHNINPFTPIFLLLIQLPILIALYQVFNEGFSDKILPALYSFVSHPDVFNNSFLGLVDLQQSSMVIVLLAALAQYIHGKISLPKPGGDPNMAKIAQKMVYIGPALTLAILWNFPAALGVYWLTSTLFSIIQQKFLDKQLDKMEFHKQAAAK